MIEDSVEAKRDRLAAIVPAGHIASARQRPRHYIRGTSGFVRRSSATGAAAQWGWKCEGCSTADSPFPDAKVAIMELREHTADCEEA